MNMEYQLLKITLYLLLCINYISAPKALCFSINTDLVIRDGDSGCVLWKCPVQKGEDIYYAYIHSVYQHNVCHKYKICADTDLLFVSVISSPVVLLSPYPGYFLPANNHFAMHKIEPDEIEIKINRKIKDMLIAVGDEKTNKRLLVGLTTVSLRQLGNNVKVVKIYVEKNLHRYQNHEALEGFEEKIQTSTKFCR